MLRSASTRRAPGVVRRSVLTPGTTCMFMRSWLTTRSRYGEAVARTIFVLTHPEATHHVDGLVGGWHDSDLTPRGMRDAGAIAQALAQDRHGEAGSEVHSSDSLRARRAAEPIAVALGTVAILDRRLREKSYGAAEGRPQRWLDERFVVPRSPAIG